MSRRLLAAGAMVAGLCLPAPAQYLGGSGDGYDRKTLHNFPMDRVYPPAEPAIGGSGDGYAQGTLFNFPLNGSNDPPVFAFLGGAGDGWTNAAIYNFPLNGSNNPPAVAFLGGPGDGWTNAAIYNFPLNGSNNPPTTAFLGGAGDGWINATTFNIPLDGSNNPPADAYLGGAGDGFHSSQTANTPLAGPPPIFAFLGGSGDGYDSSQTENTPLSGPPPVYAFLGGPGDGYDNGTSLSLPLTGTDLLDPYLGGAGDGHSHTSLFNVVIDPTPPPYAIIGYSPNPAACLQIVNFTSAGSFSLSNNIVAFNWDFGDSVTTSGTAVSHAYNSFGTYTASLSAVDDAVPAQYGYASVVVLVTNRPPVAQPGGPYQVLFDQPLTLDGSLSSDPDTGCGDQVATYEWGFGVSGPFAYTSTAPTYVISISTAGVYTLRLRATDTAGSSHTASTTITVLSAGYLSFELAEVTSPENKPTLAINVIRTNGSAGAVSIEYVTSNGTALAGADFVGVTGVVALAAGQATAAFVLGVTDDAANEGEETFNVHLRAPQGWARLGGRSNFLVRIQENDVPGMFNLGATNYLVDESAAQVVARIERSVGAVGAVSVQFETLAGSATAGADYTITAGTLNFADGEFSQAVALPILQDTSQEGTEQFTFRIKNAGGGASLGSSTSAVVQIVDDDLTLEFSASSYPVSEGGGSAVVTVVRSGLLTTTTRVDYATANETAVDGNDYIGVSGTLNFTSGQASAVFSVPVINDAVVNEPDETLRLTLSNPAPGTSLGARRIASIAIRDNDSYRLNESLNNGLPAGWTIKANQNPKAKWSFNNPGNRSPNTGGSGRFAIADSDNAGQVKMDTELITPTLDLRDITTVRLSFRYDYVFWPGSGKDIADVDVSANGGSGPWVNVWRRNLSSDLGPKFADFDVSAWLAGKQRAAVRFHFYNAYYDGWWQVDDVALSAISAEAANPGRIRLAAPAYTVRENEGRAMVTAIRVGGSVGTVQATLQTVGGSAISGTDFNALTATLVFPSGVESVSASIGLIDDLANENLETLQVALSNPTGGATLDTPTNATVTIVDDEGALADLGVGITSPPDPLLRNSNLAFRVAASNNGPQVASHVIVQHILPPSAILISTSLSKGVASTAAGTISWNIGGLNPFEEALMVLTCRVASVGTVTNGAAISGDEADVLTENDTAAVTNLVRSGGKLQFAASTFEKIENGGSVEISVVRFEDTLGPAAVSFTTLNGTALAGADYTSTNGVLAFEDGQLGNSFLINIANDALLEGNEFLYVRLSTASGSELTANEAAVTIVDDEVLSVRTSEGFGTGSRPGLLSAGPPSGWTIENNIGTNGWRLDNPGARTNLTGGSGGFAIADSLLAYTNVLDTELRSPVYDFSDLQTVVMEFKTDLQRVAAQAEVQSSTNGKSGPWTMVWSCKEASYPGPQTISVDVTAAVAGRSNVCLAFHFYNATNDGWWQVDNFSIIGEEDSDLDGLPDWWESLNFLGLAEGATNDFDNDGVSNLSEWQSDTSPTNYASTPEIRRMTVTSNMPTVIFLGSPVRLYDVEGATNLRTGIWSAVETSIPGAGGVQTNALGGVESNLFFRLRIRSF